MANLLNTNFNYTWDGKTSTEVLIRPAVKSPDIASLFTIREGIKSKEQISKANELSKIIKARGAGCDRTLTGTGPSISNITLETTQLEVFLEQCKDAFEETVLELLLNAGIEVNDLTDTQIGTMIEQMVADALSRDYFRIFSFGSTNNPSTDYSMFNGLWPKLITSAGEYCTTRAGSALGTTLSDGEALATLKAAYTDSDIRLKQMMPNEKAFHVTGSFAENLIASYESNTSGSDLQLKYMEDGIANLRYRGIPVISHYAWDQHLEADSPLGESVKHLMLYTTKKNHLIGVERASDQGVTSSWYERKDRKYYIESESRMGYEFLFCELNTIAY